MNAKPFAAAALIVLSACTQKSAEPSAPEAAPAPAAAAQAPAPANEKAAAAPAAPAVPQLAQIQPLKDSKVSGELTLTELPSGGVKVEGELKGLAPNSTHGFHVHEKGDCSAPDGASAGPHFNPAGHEHGDGVSPFSHSGDLGNVTADAAGVAKVSIVKKEASVAAGAYYSYVGRSIVVHKSADDLKSQPAGASGDKIACGVIKPKG